MNANLAAIKSKFIVLAAGLAIAGTLSNPHVAYSAEAIGHAALTQPGETRDLGDRFTPAEPSDFALGTPSPSYLLSPVQDEAISNVLLMFLYLALPAAVGLALWQHDKHAQEQLARLTSRIALLERIWQHPHA